MGHRERCAQLDRYICELMVSKFNPSTGLLRLRRGVSSTHDPMDFTSMLDQICDLERRFPVDRWKLGNTPIWPTLRVQLYFALRDSSLNDSNINKRTEQAPRAAPSKQLCSRVDALFYSRSHFRENFNGTFWDRHCDLLRKNLEQRGITTALLESASSRPHRYPVELEESFFEDPKISFSKTTMRFYKMKLSIGASLAGYEDFRTELKTLPIRQKTLSQFKEKALISRFAQLQILSKKAANSLRKTKPKIVFITCYYSLPSLAIVWACRRLKIPIVDIQHGMQHHAAYQDWTVKTLGDRSFCPTHFWVWGESDKEKLDKWITTTSNTKSLIGGYPWASFVRSHNQTNRYVEKLQQLKANRKIGLISLPTYKAEIPDYLIDAIKQSSNQVLWLIRTHPRMPEMQEICIQKFQLASINEETLTLASETPLISLLDNCDLHLTWESTVIHEAHLSGVPSIAIEPDAATIYPEALSLGSLVIANHTTLLKQINQQLTYPTEAKKENKAKEEDALSSLLLDAQIPLT